MFVAIHSFCHWAMHHAWNVDLQTWACLWMGEVTAPIEVLQLCMIMWLYFTTVTKPQIATVATSSSARLTQKRSPMIKMFKVSTVSLILLLCQDQSLVLFCAAVPTGTRCSPVKGREAETCVCQTDKGVIDLTPIATTDGTPRWSCLAKQQAGYSLGS